MRLFLDTEFNGFGGELISMALVGEDGREFYRVLALPVEYDPWVEENVVPHLQALPAPVATSYDELAMWLNNYLAGLRDFVIIADWPADFEHFANLLSLIGKNGGFKEAFPCTMRLINVSGQLKPEVPHNALSDARALRDWYMAELAAA